MRLRTKCEMIIAHHSDCDCSWCRSHVDERCGKPAIASSERVRVCEECAIERHREDMAVVYDDLRAGVAS